MYMATELHELKELANAHGHGHTVEVCGKGHSGLTYSVLTAKGKRKLYSVTPLRVWKFFEGRRAAGIQNAPTP